MPEANQNRARQLWPPWPETLEFEPAPPMLLPSLRALGRRALIAATESPRRVSRRSRLPVQRPREALCCPLVPGHCLPEASPGGLGGHGSNAHVDPFDPAPRVESWQRPRVSTVARDVEERPFVLGDALHVPASICVRQVKTSRAPSRCLVRLRVLCWRGA